MNTSELKTFIKSKRETLTDSSVTTYASILRSLHKKVFDTEMVEEDNLKNTDKILDFLSTYEPNRRKTILSALFIVTGEEAYREQMMSDISSYNELISTQQKSERQEENWPTQDEIKLIYKKLEKRAKELYKKEKENLTKKEFQEIQSYIILALLSGIHIPVRRLKDYTEMKIKNVDEKSNYISDKMKELVFVNYKTAKTYKEQRLSLPIKLKNILKKWIEINPTDYLLFDTAFNKLNSVKLNQRLQQIFQRPVSVNLLRHSILSDKYADTIKQKQEQDEYMTKMGSSINMLDVYVKS